MNNSVNLTVTDPDGTDRDIIIEGVYKKLNTYGLINALDYSITAFDLLSDKEPELLGHFHFSPDKKHWVYDGVNLSIAEQQQIAEFILSYKD